MSLEHAGVALVDAEMLNVNAVVVVLALVVVAALAVLFVVRYFSLRRSVSIGDPGPLSGAERRELEAWARRTKVAFAGAMLFVVLNGVLLIAVNPAPPWVGWLSLGAAMIILVVGLAIHFSGRCPRCGYMIGLQSPLLLPYRCERCKTPFR